MIRLGNYTEGIIIEGVSKLPDQSYFDIEGTPIGDKKIIIGESLSDNLGIDIGDKVIITPLINSQGGSIIQKFNLIEVGGLFKSGMQEYDKTIAYVWREHEGIHSMQSAVGDERRVEILRKECNWRVKVRDYLRGFPYVTG